MPQKKILIMGGTFDPPHIGHQMSAERAQAELLADEFLIIPAYMPPHKKQGENGASAVHRFNMSKLAFSPIGNVAVSDIELNRPEKNYTVDTLKELKKTYKDELLIFLVGSDMFLGFEKWKDFAEILKMVTLAVVARNLNINEQIDEMKRHLEISCGAQIIFIDAPPYEVSSTQIRKMIKNGEDITGLVCGDVREYIESNGLYK